MRNILLALLSVMTLAGCSSGEPGRPDDAVVRGVHYVGVAVSDIERSANFYREIADLESVENGEFHHHPVIDALVDRTGAKASTKLMRSVNAQLRLMEFENPSAAAVSAGQVEVYGPGIAHLCFQVNKETKSYQRFLEAGGVAIGDREMAQLNPASPVSYAYGRDFDQAIIEIEHVNFEALDLDTPPENDYRIRHISLATPDVDRAAKFYSILLQEENPRRVGNWFPVSGEKVDMVSGLPGSKLKFAWFQVRNLELEIIQYVSHPTELADAPRPADAHGYNMIVFDVVDLDAASERLIAAGGTVVVEDKPMDGGKVMFGRDPDGNLLGFQQLPDDSVLSSQNFSGNGT
ncbi:VOC family protein [Exilibacterium tricleocarpae]|uniref:VOC family protein n=1 Tax=Exilibacterium tricleocarpae TaxID=2591008 RepID=A0A545TNH2_9GAMM|nr:VOC family protein [Exilibacterium tricleocarpae]TQV78773.1 VOC family protein [Exilibacterium tricleocarpae]